MPERARLGQRKTGDRFRLWTSAYFGPVPASDQRVLAAARRALAISVAAAILEGHRLLHGDLLAFDRGYLVGNVAA